MYFQSDEAQMTGKKSNLCISTSTRNSVRTYSYLQIQTMKENGPL